MSAIQKDVARLVSIASTLMAFSSVCSATPLFNLSVSGGVVVACPLPAGAKATFSLTGVQPLTSPPTTISGTCAGNPPVIDTATAAATAVAGGESASASTSGAGSAATALGKYMDTFTLHPLPGFGPGVTFSVTSTYTLSSSPFSSNGADGIADVGMAVPLFGFNKQVGSLLTGGTISGLLNSSQFTFVKCPCVFSATFSAEAGAVNGGSASATDPITINLPPGWTYTAASQASAVPEPAGLVGIGGVLLVLRRFIRDRRAGELTGAARS